MAVLDTYRTAHADSAGPLARIWLRTLAAVIEWNTARQTRKALAGLTDRELYDIGLHRGEIDGLSERQSDYR